MKHVLVWFLVLSAGRLGAQALSSDSLASRYPFLDLGSNTLLFPGDTARWQTFFAHLRDMRTHGGRQWQVMHIGGSHVQAGTLSRTIRQGLARACGDSLGGRPGFFFPYGLAGTNPPREVRSSSPASWTATRSARRDHPGPFGLAALTACSTDPDLRFSLCWVQADGDTVRFPRVRLLADIRPVSAILEADGPDCPGEERPLDALGSREWCFPEAQSEAYVHVVDTLPEGPDTFRIFGCQYLYDDPGLIFHLVGANGASLHSYLRSGLMESHLTLIGPDLVILGIGVNDAHVPSGQFDPDRFMASYDSLLRIFHRANPETRFIFLTNNDTRYKRRVNRNGPVVREAMLALAARWDAAVWDQFTVMGGLGSQQAWQKAGLAKRDGLHFTSAGYILAGQLFCEAFRQAESRFFPPPHTAGP